MATGQTVDVTQVIDGGRFGKSQWMVAIWCFVLVTLDGFDNGAINFAAPVIVKEWGIAMPTFTSVFVAGLFGLMIGALCSGPLADRFGRKLVLLTSTLVLSVFALATALAHSIDQLWVLRFFTGIGVGGLMPNSIALTAEYAPRRIRATAVAVMFLGFPLGAGAPGWLGPALIPSLRLARLLHPRRRAAADPAADRDFRAAGIDPLSSSIAAIGRTWSRRCSIASPASTNSTAPSNSRCRRTGTFPDSRSSICSPKAAPSIPCCCGSPSSATCSSSIISQAGCRWCCAIRACRSTMRFASAASTTWAGIVSTLVLGPVVDRLGATRVVTVLYVLAAAFVFAHRPLGRERRAALDHDHRHRHVRHRRAELHQRALGDHLSDRRALHRGGLGAGRRPRRRDHRPGGRRHAARRAHPAAQPVLHDRGAGAGRRAVRCSSSAAGCGGSRLSQPPSR